MKQTDKLFWFLTLPVCGILLALRFYLLGNMGFPDFDSVRNWQIVQQVSHGNYGKVFHHGSPSLFLFYSLFAPFIRDYHQYIYLNALWNVLALVVLARFFKRIFGLKDWDAAALLLLMGSAVFLVHSARFFTIESPGFLLFALILQTYYKRFQEHSRSAFYRTIALGAFVLTVNYKFMLLLPIAFVLEVLFRDGLLNLKTLAWGLLILAAPYLILAVFSVAVGLPFYLFPATYISMFSSESVNAANRHGTFRFDVLYYFQYLFRFESPLAWLGLLGFPIVFRRHMFRKFNAYNYLAVVCYAFLAGMSVLLKAPRGLVWVYAIFYLFGFLVLREWVKVRSILFLLLVAFGYNLLTLNREVYAYSKSNYQEVAHYLKEHQVSKVAGTVGLGLMPYLPADIEYQVIESEKELPALQQKGFNYVLLDDYYRVTNVRNFPALENGKPLLSLREKSLEAPLLFLEHSEFTGFTFSQTMQLHKDAVADTIGLRLMSL